MNSVAYSTACIRLKGRRRRKGCDGKVRRTTETREPRRRTRGQVEAAAKAPAAADAERSENQSVYYTVAVVARLSGHCLVLRLYSDRRRAEPGSHHTVLHQSPTGQCRRLPMNA